MPSSGLVELKISSITINENSSSLRLSSLSICLFALCISASNNDSFPLQSGIFKYVFTNENGVRAKSDAKEIPRVCESNKDILMPFINVDLPPAFGPVRIILFGEVPPIFILLFIIVLSIRDGCHILETFIVGVLLFRYLV